MAETAETAVRVKTAEMEVTAVMLAQVPTQMAVMAEMEAQTEPMEGVVATEEAGIIHPVVMVVTVAVTETGETEGMLVLAAMEMAATAVMGVKTAEMAETAVMVTDPVMAETEAMRVLAASAVRLAAAGVREDMMVLPG
ncbi:hypothetical protein [Pantoea agglomerans]|uniref:hypothetical protein n=1 Tax=Enterobacter agglomerans TaxID=549 RepID=UPI003C7AB9C7